MHFATLQEAVEALEDHRKHVSRTYNDPITQDAGLDDSDFQFNRKEKAILSEILRLAPEGSKEQEIAYSGFEKWMP